MILFLVPKGPRRIAGGREPPVMETMQNPSAEGTEGTVFVAFKIRDTARYSSTRKVLRPKAQGREARATLDSPTHGIQPRLGCVGDAPGRDATPLGLERWPSRPRVARPEQPVGFGTESLWDSRRSFQNRTPPPALALRLRFSAPHDEVFCLTRLHRHRLASSPEFTYIWVARACSRSLRSAPRRRHLGPAFVEESEQRHARNPSRGRCPSHLRGHAAEKHRGIHCDREVRPLASPDHCLVRRTLSLSHTRRGDSISFWRGTRQGSIKFEVKGSKHTGLVTAEWNRENSSAPLQLTLLRAETDSGELLPTWRE